MVSHGKAFQAWKPGPFAVATLVNIALVLAFNPAQPTNEEKLKFARAHVSVVPMFGLICALFDYHHY